MMKEGVAYGNFITEGDGDMKLIVVIYIVFKG